MEYFAIFSSDGNYIVGTTSVRVARKYISETYGGLNELVDCGGGKFIALMANGNQFSIVPKTLLADE